MAGSDYHEAGLLSLIARLQPAEVERLFILRAGDALMANDDAAACLFVGHDALVLSCDDRALSVLNPDLVDELIAAGKVATVMLASVPKPMARMTLFGLVSTGRFATRQLARQVVEAIVAGHPPTPVTAKEGIRDVV